MIIIIINPMDSRWKESHVLVVRKFKINTHDSIKKNRFQCSRFKKRQREYHQTCFETFTIEKPFVCKNRSIYDFSTLTLFFSDSSDGFIITTKEFTKAKFCCSIDWKCPLKYSKNKTSSWMFNKYKMNHMRLEWD